MKAAADGNEAIWESEPEEIYTPTGNRITRREALYETPTSFLTVRLTYVLAADSQLAKAETSEAEIQYLGKAANEGLTAEALVQTLQ